MPKPGASGSCLLKPLALFAFSAHPPCRVRPEKRLRKNELWYWTWCLDSVPLIVAILRGLVIRRTRPCAHRRCKSAVQEAHGCRSARGPRGRHHCGDVDSAARGVRRTTVFSTKLFLCTELGHGLGLEVPEEPRVARGQKQFFGFSGTSLHRPGVTCPGPS